MNQPDKIRVAVLYGGRSGEHEVSLMSAANVIQHLDPTRFEVIPIGIDKQGVWFLGDHALCLSDDKTRMLFNPESLGKQVQYLTPTKTSGRIFDVIFPAIHGTFCEDGTIQGLLELADIPYVGCGVLASAIGMDKDVSKRLVSHHNIRTAPYLVVTQGQWNQSAREFCHQVNQKLKFPVFVKPANTGSSVGIEKIKQPEQLAAAIHQAFQFDTKVLVEQGIDGIELEVAVLESLEYGKDPIVSVVGEVRPSHEFYSYEAKYLDEKGAELFIPAEISVAIHEQVQNTAKEIFTALECEGLSRVDLFLEKDTNHIYFNEVNTLPGFTQISMYPKLMAASGIHYSELLTHLVMLAIARHKRKSILCREHVTN